MLWAQDWGRVRRLDEVDFGRVMAVQVSEITDRTSFEAWLEEVPEDRCYELAVALATRCALRVFPIWAGAEVEGTWNQGDDWKTLSLLHCLLASGVATKKAGPAIRVVSGKLMHVAADIADSTRFTLGATSRYAAVADAASDVSRAAALPAEASRSAALTADAVNLWSDLHKDIQELDGSDDLLSLPLWPEEVSSEIANAWSVGRSGMQANPGYSFWIRWYEAILEGRPLTGTWQSHWQLMQDIALIAPEDWDKGLEHVAGVIDLISQKHALQREVARTKRALENETFNAETLGKHRDNLPDDLPPARVVQYRAQLREVLQELEAVEAALEPPVPDVEVLEEATGRLRAAWAKIKRYPLAAGFVVLMGAAATGAAGQLGVRGIDWIIDEGAPALIQSLRSGSPKPSPAPQAPRHALGERIPDKR